MSKYEDKKICSLAKNGVPEDDPKGYAALVNNPVCFCKKCGRAAGNRNMVCKPVAIHGSETKIDSKKQKKKNKVKKKKKDRKEKQIEQKD